MGYAIGRLGAWLAAVVVPCLVCATFPELLVWGTQVLRTWGL